MDIKEKSAEFLEFLKQFLTEERWEKFNEVIAWRTRFITIVLEDIYQSQNASAVLRTCDLTGIQDLHVIENVNPYDINPDVTLGSNKWINLFRYNKQQDNTLETFDILRNRGYKIVATSPHKSQHLLETLPLDKPIALVLGNELTGLSDTALNQADAFVRIPMHGFTESFNISVSAALLLYNLTNRLRQSNADWQLSPEEKTDIMIEWCMRTLPKSELIAERFFSEY
jgi:tRNA (guanosine-2'-O-)-methyltransferase